jgi:hypothetical protein
MTARIVPLRRHAKPPTAEQLVTRVRGLALQTAGVRFDHPHFKQRLAERKLNMRQVLETVKKGCAVGDPILDQWGDWRIKLRRKVAGRRVQVVLAVKTDHCVAVTVT